MFTEIIKTGLKANKSFTRFYLRYKKECISKRKLFDYSDKVWDKRTRVAQAKTDSMKAKSKTGVDSAFDENSSIDHIAKLYFDVMCDRGKWTEEKRSAYCLHVQSSIGRKKVKDLRAIHID